MSNYLVVGLGRFGRSVAKTLYKNGKTVLALEQNEELVQQAIEYQIVDEAIILDVTDEKSLKKIVKDNFDTAIVCIGSDMQSSILVTLILKEIGVAREEVIAIGDGYNDLSMIRFAGLGIAMGNAQEPVKKAADYITLSNEEDGVAEAINKFCNQQ